MSKLADSSVGGHVKDFARAVWALDSDVPVLTQNSMKVPAPVLLLLAREASVPPLQATPLGLLL